MEPDLKMIYTLFSGMEIQIIDKIVLDNKLYILYNNKYDILSGLSKISPIYLTILNLLSYKIIKNYKYYGYSSYFTDEHYIILSDYNTLNIYNIIDNKLKILNLNYNEYKYDEKIYANDDDIKNIFIKSYGIKLINVNNTTYICNNNHLDTGMEIIIININKETIRKFETKYYFDFYEGLNNILLVGQYYMMNYDLHYTLTKINYENNFSEIYSRGRYKLKDNLSDYLFKYNDGFVYGPIKISNTIFLCYNFTYNTLKNEYNFMDLVMDNNYYLLSIEDFININSSNIINNNLLMYENKIYFIKENLNVNDLKLIEYSKIINDIKLPGVNYKESKLYGIKFTDSNDIDYKICINDKCSDINDSELIENKLSNIDIDKVFVGDLKNIYRQLLLNNITNNIYLYNFTTQENNIFEQGLLNISSSEYYKQLLSKIINNKDIIEYIFFLKFICY